jgi:hypothetical protein
MEKKQPFLPGMEPVAATSRRPRQATLPGLEPGPTSEAEVHAGGVLGHRARQPTASRPVRRHDHIRVWSDPAVVQAGGEAHARFEEWRDSFADFIAHLPEEQRAELRTRLSGQTGRRSAGRAA